MTKIDYEAMELYSRGQASTVAEAYRIIKSRRQVDELFSACPEPLRRIFFNK